MLFCMYEVYLVFKILFYTEKDGEFFIFSESVSSIKISSGWSSIQIEYCDQVTLEYRIARYDLPCSRE